MTGGLLEESRPVDDGATLRVGRGEDQAPYARVADRPSAHRTRLEGNEEFEACQTIVAPRLGGPSQGDDLGVGGGVMRRDRPVARRRRDGSGVGVEHHRAHRGFAAPRGGLRLFQGSAHHRQIMVRHPPEPRGAAATGQAGAITEGERIAKVLARAGVASRREVERLIAAGRVQLNGTVLERPGVKVGSGDEVLVDGARVAAAEPTRLFRYHKPAGLVTTHHDPAGRPTVFTRLPVGLPQLISVGRLDLASEGLLLLTNDGALARALELPATGLARRYRARARGRIDQTRLDRLRDGLVVGGVRYGRIEARLDKAKVADAAAPANLWISLALTEGKNREVRRVLEALGLEVNRLIRLAYGPLALGDLAAGAVEEVGPRVLREQFGPLIAARSLPDGDRARWPPPSAASPGAEPPRVRKIYKPGWARPRIGAPGISGGASPPPPPRRRGAAAKGGRPPR